MNITIHCCECDTHIIPTLISGKEKYPHRPDLFDIPIWRCDTCGNTVGCHHKSQDRLRPLGCIPSKELQALRIRIHALLDPIWKHKQMPRSAIYSKLTKVLGREYHTAELRTVEEANRIIDALRGMQ